MPTSSEEELHLPEANEFSPGQIQLGRVLTLVAENKGDREAIVEAIRSEFFSTSAAKRTDPAERLKQQRTRANNVLIGMKGYGLFSLETNSLTPSGELLLKEEDEPARLQAFALLILRTRHGLDVLEAVRDLRLRGTRITKESLAAELRKRGFRLPRATTHHTKLIQWLREAGLVDAEYQIDQEKVDALVGIASATLSDLALLTRPQRAFLTTLRRMVAGRPGEDIPAKTVIDAAVLEHGPIFKEDQLRAQIFAPLEKQEWVAMSAGAGGRGGKSGTILPTTKLLGLDIEELTGTPFGDIPPDVRKGLNRPLTEIFRDLDSDDKHVKGIALELLALKIVTDLNLTPISVRLRGVRTGGAEVDVIAEASHLTFSRWLIQCKNIRGSVTLNALAKEVGLATLLRAHLVVIATTGKFGRTVQEFADELTRTSWLQVLLMDGELLRKYMSLGARVLMEFAQESAIDTMKKKRDQVIEVRDAVEPRDERD